MKTALECGCNYWNGGEFYGKPENNSLALLRKYFAKYPEDADKVVVCIKGATRVVPTIGLDGSKEFVTESMESCLRTLGSKGRIDEFECARKDPNVPYEESILAIAEFVKAGRIGAVACSEVSASTLRKAAAVTKISTCEVELSLWNTDPLTNGLAQTCAELGITMVAYGKPTQLSFRLLERD
jgi:pyridoxine 4-dehydrogenase